VREGRHGREQRQNEWDHHPWRRCITLLGLKDPGFALAPFLALMSCEFLSRHIPGTFLERFYLHVAQGAGHERLTTRRGTARPLAPHHAWRNSEAQGCVAFGYYLRMLWPTAAVTSKAFLA